VTISEQPADEVAARAYPFGEPERLVFDPTFAEIREHEPLAPVRLPYGEPMALMITRYDDVRVVHTDPRFSRAAAATRDRPRLWAPRIPAGISGLDPPEHTRLRALVGKAFTVRRVEQLRPRVEQIAADLLDAMLQAGPPADLMESFAVPLPATVICELLGVPYDDRGRFRLWTDAFMSVSALPMEEKLAHRASLARYLADMVAQRRERPTDDLIGALVQARDEQDRLTEDEMITFAMTLLAAGYETTASQLGNFTYLLLTHPDQLALLRGGQVGVPQAVEELLRFVPLSDASPLAWYATEDVELSSGVVRAGEWVLVSNAAANRDPRVVGDPERLDLTRPPMPHLAFGHGTHHCTGAQLARMELQVGLRALLDRCPELRLPGGDAQPQWKVGMAIRGPEALPIAW
jgi:cytochrome P450